MNKNKLLFAPLLLVSLCLISCGNNSIPKDGNTPLLHDLDVKFASKTDLFETYAHKTDFDTICKMIDSKVPFLLGYFETGCSSCIEVQNVMKKFQNNNNELIYYWNAEEEHSCLDNLIDRYPTLFPDDYYTPTLFQINNLTNKVLTTSRLANESMYNTYMNEIFYTTNVYVANTYTSFETYLNQNPNATVYINKRGDSSYDQIFLEQISSLAYKSTNDLIICDTQNFIIAHIDSLKEKLGISTIEPLGVRFENSAIKEKVGLDKDLPNKGQQFFSKYL